MIRGLGPETEPPHPELERALRAALSASYEAVPPAAPEVVDRCTRAVLTQAMHAATPTSRGLRPRWWWGAAAAAALVIGVMRPWHPEHSWGSARAAFGKGRTEAPMGGIREVGAGAVRFDLRLPPGAHEVAIVGDFNGWDDRATPMAQASASGAWSAQVPLGPGRHVYAFVVDGTRWLVDPLAPQVPDAGFGPANAVIVDGRP
jgi:hypothetical protein